MTEIWREPLPRDAELSARPRHLRELPGRGAPRAGVASSDGATVRDIELGDGGGAHAVSIELRRKRHETCAPLARRRLRPRRADQAQAASSPETTPRCQRGVVPHRRADRRSTTGPATPAWRDALRPAVPLALDQPPGGRGYWVWLIPLASGSHSVGIVADAKLHPLETMNSFEKAMDVAAASTSRGCSHALDGKRAPLQDFAFLRHFSYGCKQVFSGERWALTGEAGLFLDPFYSPGTRLHRHRQHLHLRADRARPRRPSRSRRTPQIYEQLFHSFYESTLALYQRPVPDLRRPRGACRSR